MRSYAVTAALTLLVLTGCADDPRAEPGPHPGTTSSSSAVSGGAAAEPAAVDPGKDLLAWRPAPGDTGDTVTAGGVWILKVNRARTLASLDGPRPVVVEAPRRFAIADTLLTDDHAVVVTQDTLEEQPSRATVVTLATGDARTIDGRSKPPTVNGGTWAIGDTTLVHATYARGGRYCLAEHDLTTLDGSVLWCAEKGHGFSGARSTPAGLTVMVFDDSRPSCRTVGVVADSEFVPLAGATECKAWDSLLTGDGAVWTVVPHADQIDAARARARIGERFFDLGPATSGSLVWCGGAAFFTRDPAFDGGPAQVLRWRDGQLDVVYESRAGGEAILSAPRCGGDTLTVTALTEQGDEQVSARVG